MRWPIEAVVFDVGETLVDETRVWASWAAWLDVPALTLFGAIGTVIARGGHHREALNLVRPGIDVEAERRARAAADAAEQFLLADVYADVLPCLAAIRAAGRKVGLAGNIPADAEQFLRKLGEPGDLVASSATIGAEKPSLAFFGRIAELAMLRPSAIAYVGDRLDNDVLPAKAAGMVAVHVRRGPWGIVHAAWPEAAQADLRLESLGELPAALDRLTATG